MVADARTPHCTFNPKSVTSIHIDSGFEALVSNMELFPAHLTPLCTLILESRVGETCWHPRFMDENTGLTALDSVYYRTQHPLSSLTWQSSFTSLSLFSLSAHIHAVLSSYFIL